MLPILPLIGATVGILDVVSILALHAGRAVVPRTAVLGGVCQAIVHPDLADLLGDVRAAVAWWRTLGHVEVTGASVGEVPDDAPGVFVVPAPPDLLARRTVALAQIGITDEPADGWSDPDVAQVDTHGIDLDSVGAIRRGVVYLDRAALVGREARRVIAHELGHAAYGFRHVTARLRRTDAEAAHGVQIPKGGHLMHPTYEEGGWGAEGLAIEDLGLTRAQLRKQLRDARRS